jgi:hydroxyacylglutathione hydrolase
MPELKAAVIPVTPFQQNCTLLWQEPDKRALVIDPGSEVPPSWRRSASRA